MNLSEHLNESLKNSEEFSELPSTTFVNESMDDDRSKELLEVVEKALPLLEKEFKKVGKFDVKLSASINRGTIQITSDDLASTFKGTAAASMFTKFKFASWGGNETNDGHIWFNPKFQYEHPSGGSNGTDALWDRLGLDQAILI